MCNKFQTQDPLTLSANVPNLVATVAWRPDLYTPALRFLILSQINTTLFSYYGETQISKNWVPKLM